mgnify:CR=1 FL=1
MSHKPFRFSTGHIGGIERPRALTVLNSVAVGRGGECHGRRVRLRREARDQLIDEPLVVGDHLAFDPAISKLYAFRRHCWYSWEEQTKSMARLLDYDFEWVLAGHGDRAKLSSIEMHQQLAELVDLMKLPAKQWYAHFGSD